MQNLFNGKLFNPGDEVETTERFTQVFGEHDKGTVKEYNEADQTVTVDTPERGEIIFKADCLRVTKRAGITVKAVSFWQPWASLMAYDLKLNETRSWSTDYRGYLAIHASRKIVTDVNKQCREAIEKLGLTIEDLPTGGIVAIRYLKNCARITADNTPADPERAYGDYTPGRYMWQTKNVKQLNGCVPVPGRQRLWTLDNDILNAIESYERGLFG